MKQAQNYIKKCYIPRKKFLAEPESILHIHKQFHKKDHTPRVCMHVDKQYQDQSTSENRFQSLQNLETVEESRQSCIESQTQGNIEVAFADNAKQEQVSKQAANTLNKTGSTKESFHSAKNTTDGAAIMANQKQSLAGNKNKIRCFDGEGNIRSMQHDQEHMNNIDLGTACDAFQQHSTAKKSNVKATKSMPCQFFNQGSCVHQKTHETRGTLYKHICSSCFAISGEQISHPEIECRNKHKKHTRNV